MTTSFAAVLKRQRERRGISQSKLAELIDCDHTYISRLEMGVRQPSRDIVDRIAAELGSSPFERAALIGSAFLPADLIAVPASMRAEFV